MNHRKRTLFIELFDELYKLELDWSMNQVPQAQPYEFMPYLTFGLN